MNNAAQHRATVVHWRQIEASGSTPGPKYCTECGTANDANAAYCVGCQKKFFH